MLPTVRPFDAARDRYDALVDACGPATRARARELPFIEDAVRAKNGDLTRVVAELDGRVVGWAHSRDGVDYPEPGRRYLDVEVHPSARGHGLARRLLEEIGARTARETTQVVGFAYGASRGALRLAQTLGCETADVEHRLRLDLARELPPLSAIPEGVVVRALPELKETRADWEHALYEVQTMAQGEAPSHMQYVRPPFEVWRDKDLLVDNALHDGLFIALDGERWVGMTELRAGAEGEVETNLTAVEASHRRRGIARGLKERALQWAKRSGYRAVWTSCVAGNAPMLAINEAAGFERAHSWHIVQRSLSASDQAAWAEGRLPGA